LPLLPPTAARLGLVVCSQDVSETGVSVRPRSACCRGCSPGQRIDR
jgi:hypothetical protein